jgi:hypothetical protein
MRTMTTKRSLGNASIGPHEMKFRSLEQNKDSKSIGKIRHKLATSDARRCLKQITMDYTEMMASNGADTLGSHTKDCGVTGRYLCEVPQMNKKSESTQGNLDDVWHERRNCEKTIQATDHWRLFAFNSERPLTMKSSKPRYKLTSQDTFGADNFPFIYLWFISNSEVDSILCLVLMMIMIV